MALQALAAAIVAFTLLYFRRLYTIDPDVVYRKAMLALNTNPGVLEVTFFGTWVLCLFVSGPDSCMFVCIHTSST